MQECYLCVFNTKLVLFVFSGCKKTSRILSCPSLSGGTYTEPTFTWTTSRRSRPELCTETGSGRSFWPSDISTRCPPPSFSPSKDISSSQRLSSTEKWVHQDSYKGTSWGDFALRGMQFDGLTGDEQPVSAHPPNWFGNSCFCTAHKWFRNKNALAYQGGQYGSSSPVKLSNSMDWALQVKDIWSI